MSENINKHKKYLFLIVFLLGLLVYPQINQAAVEDERYERSPDESIFAGKYVEVTTFQELIDAMLLDDTTYIKIMNDMDNTSGKGSGTNAAAYHPSIGYKNNSSITKVIDGKISNGEGGYRNANVNFRQYCFWLTSANPVYMYSQNLTAYAIDYYGFVTANGSSYKDSKIYNHNVHHIGSQLMRSDYQDVFFSGVVKTDVVKEYTFNGIKNTPLSGQGNLQSSNVTFAKGANFWATSEYDGQLQVLNKGKVTLGEGSTVILDTADGGDFTPNDYQNEQAPALHVDDGSVTLEKNSNLTIKSGPTRKKAAIFLDSKGSSISLEEGSQLNVILKGNDTNGSGSTKNTKTPILLKDETSLIVGENALFNVSSKDTGTGTASIMQVGSKAKFEVKRKGSFVMETDGTGNKSILDMGANSEFRFTDAQSVDIKFLNQNVHNSSRLIDMSNPGYFNVDVQKVNTWTKGNDIDSFDAPNYKSYAPMFGMIIPYNRGAVNNNAIVAASTSDIVVNEFKNNFNTATGTTGGFQRILYEFIPDVDVTIDSIATDAVNKDGSKTVTGTATPGSYLRLSTTPATGSNRPTEINPANNTVKSPVTTTTSDPQFDKMTPNFTILVPASGQYLYTLPAGTFNAGTEIEAYAFKEGKTAEVKQIVLDETPPTGESNDYLEVESGPVPDPSVFVKNPQDTNPVTQNFTYQYVTDITPLMSQVGTHEVQVYVIDNAGNKGIVKSKLIIYEASKESVIEASDFSVSQEDLSKVTNLEDFILKESKAEAYKIVNHRKEDFTSQIKVTNYGGLETTTKKGKFTVTLSVPGQSMTTQIEVIPSEVEMKVSQVYKGTNDLIYENLSDKTPVTVVTSTETIGDSIQDAIDKLVAANKLELEKTGYTKEENFIVKVKNSVVGTTEVPDENFEVIFEYAGQMYFEEVPNLEFGKIEVSGSSQLNALETSSTSTVKIINTLLDYNWHLKLSLPDPEGISNVRTNETFLGDLVYYDSSTSRKVINETGIEISSQKPTDKALSVFDVRGDSETGIRLEQKIGNRADKYSGDLLWSLEDTP